MREQNTLCRWTLSRALADYRGHAYLERILARMYPTSARWVLDVVRHVPCDKDRMFYYPVLDGCARQSDLHQTAITCLVQSFDGSQEGDVRRLVCLLRDSSTMHYTISQMAYNQCYHPQIVHELVTLFVRDRHVLMSEDRRLWGSSLLVDKLFEVLKYFPLHICTLFQVA